MMARESQDMLCDLCEEEHATNFCDECQFKVGDFCKEAHAKQKRTKGHNLADINKVTLSILKVCCSLCDGPSEKFCPECSVRLCTTCAEAHHKLDIYTVDDKAEANITSSQILSNNLKPPSFAIAEKEILKQPDVLCDLCEEETAVSFCDDCQSKLGDFCKESHKKQKQTKYHNITPIKLTKLDILHSKCSICEDRAGTFCTECNVHLCTMCCNDHHKLSETLTLRKKIININQGFEKPFEEERMPDTNEAPGSRYSLARSESNINRNESKLFKSGSSYDKTSTYSSNVGPLDGQTNEVNIPGKPSAQRVFTDSVDLAWDGVCNFGKGDVYQVRIMNIRTGQWDIQFFEKDRGNIRGLQQGATYVFKVRLVKVNGEESNYSENSEEVRTKEDRPGQPTVVSVFADSVDIVWTAVDIFCECDVYQVRIDNTKTGKWECKNFEVNRASIGGLQPGEPYTFKVRSVRANGKESKYSEYSKEVRIQKYKKIKEDRPGKPSVESVFDDSVNIVWNAVDNFHEGDAYQVRVENPKTRKWDCQYFKVNNGKIGCLQPGTPYVFKVRLVKANGEESKYSESSEEVITKETQLEDKSPGKPIVEKVYADYVDLYWEGVHNLDKGDVYQVRIENPQTRDRFFKTCKNNSERITGLHPDTSYIFKVRIVYANGTESKYGEDSGEVKTQTTFASKLVKNSVRVNRDGKGPPNYALPMTEIYGARDESAMTKKYDIGPRTRLEIDEKTIMLVGATGTGKSTLIDGLANYVVGVQLDDPWRFTVMMEEDRRNQSNQAVSQTEWISCYSFNPQLGTRLKYRLNVIDTPGFGDTRGLERDQKIVEQIRQLFEAKGEKGVQVLDAVCFLIKAPDSRLTATQTYIFNAIMSLFGHDIEGNICTLITFADGSDPPVLAAVRASGLPFNKEFTFNNSALFSDPSVHFTPMFWEMGLKSFEEMLKHVSGLQKKSMQLTKEVLQERRRLEITCQNLQPAINAGLSVIHNLKREYKLFQENKAEIKRNKQFKYLSTEIQMEKVELPAGIHVTNCLTCNRTCHKECVYADDEDKKMCTAMDAKGHCEQCPRKCIWFVHKNARYRIEYVEKQVAKTYDDMQKKYQDAKGKTLSLEQLLTTMMQDLNNRAKNIEEMVDRMRKCSNRLQEIALRPNPLGMIGHIDLMIQAEKDEAKAGYQDRIEVLKKFRETANIDERVGTFREENRSVKISLPDSPQETRKPFWKFWT